MLTILISLFFLGENTASTIVQADTIIQTSDSTRSQRVQIDKVFVVGNKVTKRKIILRELSISAGEVYDKDDLEDILETDRRKINNLRLFNTVEISTLHLSETLVDIVINVDERWYTFPVPIFDIVDRNFNDWWQNQDHDLSRTNYGLRLYRNNFRGRNESLRLQFQLGYTRQFNIYYRVPYIDKSQRHGLSFLFNYSENKNIAYTTIDHKREFIDSESILRTRRHYGIGYRFRNSFYITHTANLTFNHNDVADTVVQANNEYYLNGQTTQRYLEFFYGFRRDKRDVVGYPLHGNDFKVEFTKYGLGIANDINQFDITARYTQYSDLKRGFYLANYTAVYVSGPDEQPYANLEGLGYRNDFVRGYELFVVEAKNFYLNRTTFKKKLFSFREHLGFMPIEQFKSFPLAVYLKTYFDMGYTENIERYEENIQNTTLSGKYIFGTGVGLDFVTFYDSVLRFEYSINREGDAGLFFHVKKEF